MEDFQKRHRGKERLQKLGDLSLSLTNLRLEGGECYIRGVASDRGGEGPPVSESGPLSS